MLKCGGYMKKFILIFILCVLILFVICCIIASFYFYNVAVALTEKDFLDDDEDEPTAVEAKPVSKYEWFHNSNFQEVEIKSEDGLRLRGYYLEADVPTKKTAILAHGYNGQSKYMSRYARFYINILGYNVLMPDARGHGDSEGNYIGLGWPDRKDYLKWIDYIIDNVGEDSEIILHGVSMGGATVLMVSGEAVPENVKAIVSDCAYTSAKEQLEYQLKRMYNLPSFPIIHSTSILTKIRAGYSFGEASALNQVKKSKTPILFIHGDADAFVPYYMVNELYDKCSSEKDIFIVKGAKHATAYKDDIDGYENKVIEFLSKYVQNN